MPAAASPLPPFGRSGVRGMEMHFLCLGSGAHLPANPNAARNNVGRIRCGHGMTRSSRYAGQRRILCPLVSDYAAPTPSDTGRPWTRDSRAGAMASSGST
jgi:hypothetical protein